MILSYTEKKREKLKFADLSSNMSVFTLTSYSGSWQRKEGKIIALDRAYIGYDTLLSGTLFTGAIETDLVLEKGESGLPLWSLS